MVVTAAVVAVAALGGLVAFTLTGGFDGTTTERVAGAGVQVVRVELVDRALGFDVVPDVVEVESGTHLVLDVVNSADGEHDLSVDGGFRTERLGPGAHQRLDLGAVTKDLDGHCTIGDHAFAGMTLDVVVTKR